MIDQKKKQTTIVPTSGKLLIETTKVQLDQVVLNVKKARTFAEITDVMDSHAQAALFLRSRRAALEMGDQIEVLRCKLREIEQESEIRKCELAAELTPETRVKTATELRIPLAEMERAAIVGKLPRKTLEKVADIQHRKGVPFTTKDLVPLAKQTPERRVAAIAMLGEVRSVREAIQAAEPRIVPEWKPKAPAKLSPQVEIVDVRPIEYAKLAKEVRDAANLLAATADRHAAGRNQKTALGVLNAEEKLVALVGRLKKLTAGATESK